MKPHWRSLRSHFRREIRRSSNTITPTSITTRPRRERRPPTCATPLLAAFPEATLGRWHDELVGPHLQSMYQIVFPCALVGSFLPWLMLNRAGLTILVHPGTGNPFADHTEHAIWLGGTLPLRAEVLEGAPSAAEPQARAEERIERGNDG